MNEKLVSVAKENSDENSVHSGYVKETRIETKSAKLAEDLSFQLAISEEDLELIQSHLDDRGTAEWMDILRSALDYHKGDPLIPVEQMSFLTNLTNGPDSDQTEEDWEYWVKFSAFLFHEWSIYPEVRAVTRPIDEEDDDDYHSLRVYIIGSCWGMAGAVLSTFFALRYPSISLGNTALQLLIASTGRAVAWVPPLSIPIWKERRIVINSGKPWTFKEQMLATLTMSVSNGAPYAQYAIVAQANDQFYNFQDATQFGYMILLVLSSAYMGFGFAGIFRSFLVYPSRMVWYSLLPFLTLSRTLVQKEVRVNTNGWILTRNEFFWLFTVIWFGWYWITNTACKFLQYFDWMCWIKPDNVNLNAITGAYSGLGLNPIGTFDPTIFNYFTGILVPVEAYCNWMFGYMVSFLAIVIMWYTNVRWTSFIPINSNGIYDNTGDSYNVSRVINRKTLRLDKENYQNYSLPFWSAGTITIYGASFAVYTAGIVYAILNYGSLIYASLKGLMLGFRRGEMSVSHFKDTFSRRQARHKEVPEWWFMLALVGSIGAAIGCVEGYRFTETPVWTIFLGIGIAAVFIPISGILYATTTYTFETNVLMELIIGYACPGNPNALMVSKVYATNFFSQADNWITNQKQAHYAGISPRSLFSCQMISTLCTSFVQTGIMTWQVGGGIPNLCKLDNINLFTCQETRVYFNASVLWGTIGPHRVFKGLYPTLPYTFLIGALLPIPFWAARKFLPVLARRYGLQEGSSTHYWISGVWLRNCNEMVMLMAPQSWAPSNITYFIGDFYICLLFQLFVKRRYPEWWSKYAYIFYAAVNNGSGWAGFFDFFATQYKNIVTVNWWGNSVDEKTADYNYTAVRYALEPGQYFGPKRGEYP